MIVDDEPDHVAMLATILRQRGHAVESATNPLYALTLAATFSPEVIFLDLGLPYMDGHEAGRRFKRRFTGARVYAITGRADDEARQKSAQAGFDGHLVKPLDIAAIEALLAGASPA